MKHILLTSFIGAALTSSITSYAEERVEIPAQNILIAARNLVPQTSPYYSVEGVLKCAALAKEAPPYGGTETCTIRIEGETIEVENPSEILDVLYTIQERRGPAYQIELPFIATSNSSEAPPYGVKEKAEVIVNR